MFKSTHCDDAVRSKKHPVIFQNHPLLNCRGLDQLGARNKDYKSVHCSISGGTWLGAAEAEEGKSRRSQKGDCWMVTKVNMDLPSTTTSGLILEWCFRDLDQSGDSSSLSSDDDEVSTSPAGVTTCQSSGPGWILCFLGKGSSALQCTTRQNA